MPRKGLRLLLIPAVALLFLGLGANTIWDANEAFYVDTPRQMIRSGDYLNPVFFLARFVIYFAIWYTFIHLLNKWGRRSEENDDANARYNLKGLSGPGVIVWALSGTLAVTDWVMSVEPTWASSISSCASPIFQEPTG